MRHKYLFFIIGLSILPAIPFFTSNDLLHTHDGLVHLPRLAAYFHALADGNFPVRIAGYLNYGYGLPLFNFIYQFPYWVGSLLLLLGFGLVNAFKLSLILSFILSGISMYLFGKEFFGDEKKGFLVAIFYQFAPFRMVELLVRGSYGEVYAYAFLPAVLYGIALLNNKRKGLGFLVTSLSTFFLITSHNSVSLLFFGACFLFILFTSRKIKEMIIPLFSLFWGLIMASFYWFPALYDHKYTYGNLYMQNLYKDHFVPIQNFFIPNFNNDPRLFTEGISTFLGLFQIVGFVLAMFLLTKKLEKNTKRIFWYCLVLLAVSFFMMSSLSQFIWGASFSSFLRQFQFPWRFLALAVFSLSILSVSFLYNKTFSKKTPYIMLIIFTVLSVALYWKASLGYKKIDENYYKNFPLNTTYYGETDVIWSAGPAKKYPKKTLEIIGGQGKVTNFQKKNHYQTFTSTSDRGISVLSNTQYFPGWSAYIDGNEVPIQFQDANNRGNITFDIPSGKHEVLIKFEETKPRLVADIISLIGFVLLIPVLWIFSRKK